MEKTTAKFTRLQKKISILIFPDKIMDCPVLHPIQEGRYHCQYPSEGLHISTYIRGANLLRVSRDLHGATPAKILHHFVFAFLSKSLANLVAYREKQRIMSTYLGLATQSSNGKT